MNMFKENNKSLLNHNFVDLGLPSGTLWATSNIGATATDKNGSFFAYGETSHKPCFTWDNYIFGYGDKKSLVMARYLPGNAVLKPTNDAANVRWGEAWKVPSGAQFQELVAHCSWKHSKKGLTGTSKINGRKIFFPASGYAKKGTALATGWSGNYRTSNLHAVRDDLSVAFHFDGRQVGLLDNCERFLGLSVRPVISFTNLLK